MKKVCFCKIKSIKGLCDGVFDMWIESPEIAVQAAAGQFVHIKCGNGTLLRRPISVCDTGDDAVRLVFEVKGEGTKWLASRRAGDVLDVLGPLGHGFEPMGERPVIIGGGIGVFPLLMLAKRLKNPRIFLGFRDCTRVVMEDEFDALGCISVCTDDGSYGKHELVTAEAKTAVEDADMVYACGPVPMLREVQKLAADAGVRAQISLEERMGCGVGACLVCVCKAGGHFEKVCQKGPVFWSSEVSFDD